MRILVTGGAGFVGTNLIKRLLRDGHDVVSFDNYSTGYKENHQVGCEYIDIDITNNISLPWMFSLGKKFDVIFHLAALARIQPSIRNPKPPINTNFNGTLNILEYARENNVQVIYAGSSTKHHGVYKSPYAWSKYGGEQLCELYSKVYDLNTAICRFYNVYGENHIRTGEYATVVGIFEYLFKQDKPLTITSDGEQRRDFTHVDDIVDALVRCIGKDFRAEEFELGRGVNHSINDIADMFGVNYPKKYIDKRPGEYPETLCEDENAFEKLGWKAIKDIKDYIENWLEDNKNV
tara:strand:- start:607 stop:1482 length:876 start_codon:yes stop_codon:yes gene_type:complete